MNPPRKFLIPEWDGSVYQKWAYRYCQTNLWRVSQHLGSDMEDVMAQAALIYVICRQRYGATVNSAKHFMYCYQLYLRMEFNTYALKDGKGRKAKEGVKESLKIKEQDSNLEVDFNLKLSNASSELKQVLEIMFNAPTEVMDTIRKDMTSISSKGFWSRVLEYCKITTSPAKLEKELEELLK